MQHTISHLLLICLVFTVIPSLDNVTATDRSDSGSDLEVRRVHPRYPVNAILAGVEGKVVLFARIDSEGRVRDIRIVSVSSEGYGFEKACVESLQKWHFESSQGPGHPIPPRLLTVTFSFSLH